MPTSNSRGSSYAGHSDASDPGKLAPEWVESAPVSRETPVEPEPAPPEAEPVEADVSRETAKPKPTPKRRIGRK